MAESLQHRLDNYHPPRVHITYDVEIGNAKEQRELPFIVGILANLSQGGQKKVLNHASLLIFHELISQVLWSLLIHHL